MAQGVGVELLIKYKAKLSTLSLNEIPVLQFLKRYLSILLAADGHFINYRSLVFRLSDSLIRCC